MAIFLLPILLFLARPHWFFGVASWALQMVGRPPLHAVLTSRQLVGLLSAAIIHWALWGCAFAALTAAISGEAAQQLSTLAPHLIASFAIAYTIGFISFITPSGFGVREGAFVLLLAPLTGSGLAALAALAMRVWSIIGELGAALVSMLVEQNRPMLDRQPPTADN